MTEKLCVDRDGHITRVTIDRPNKVNPLDVETLKGLLDAQAAVRDDDAIKLLTVRGAGGNFSAGADLSLFKRAAESGDRETVERFIATLHEVMNGFEAMPVPTLAAIEGVAFAGGLELLLSCDLRIATADAQIADHHANYGLVAGAGGTQRLQRQLPLARANDLMYTGRVLSGTEAAEWGLVSRAVPTDEFDDAVADLERHIADWSREAMSLTKKLMQTGERTDKAAGLELEQTAVVNHYLSTAALEGVTAFAEGRDPEFE